MVAKTRHGWRIDGWLKHYLYFAGALEREAASYRRNSREYRRLMEGAAAFVDFTAEGLIVEMGYTESDLVDAGFPPSAIAFAISQTRHPI